MLKQAGVPLGADLRGNAVASYVVASATDGYQVVFSLRRTRSRASPQRHHRRRHHRRQAALRLPGPVADRRAQGLARRPVDPHARAPRGRASPQVATDDAQLAFACVAGAVAGGRRGRRAPAGAAAPTPGRCPPGFPAAGRAGRQPDVRGARSSSAGICSTTRGCPPTARSRAAPATNRRGRSPTAAPAASARPAQLHPRGSMSLVNVAYAASADLGQSDADPARGSGARADVRRAPGRAGARIAETRGSTRCRAMPTYQRLFAGGLPRADRGHVARPRRQGARQLRAGASSRRGRRTTAITSSATTPPSRMRPSAARSCSTAGRCRASPVTAACTSPARWAALPADAVRVPQHRALQPRRPAVVSGRATPASIEMTRDAADVGKFKAPTLRNIAVTAPYMHDGSVATLERGDRSLRRRRPDHRRRPQSRRRPRQPQQERRRSRLRADRGQRADLIAFLRVADRRSAAARPAVRQPLAHRRGEVSRDSRLGLASRPGIVEVGGDQPAAVAAHQQRQHEPAAGGPAVSG